MSAMRPDGSVAEPMEADLKAMRRRFTGIFQAMNDDFAVNQMFDFIVTYEGNPKFKQRPITARRGVQNDQGMLDYTEVRF